MERSFDHYKGLPATQKALGEGLSATGNARVVADLQPIPTESYPLKLLIEVGLIGTLLIGGYLVWGATRFAARSIRGPTVLVRSAGAAEPAPGAPGARFLRRGAAHERGAARAREREAEPVARRPGEAAPTTLRVGEARSWAPAWIGEAQIRLAVAGAMVVSAALCLWLSRGLTFTIDQITWFSFSPHLDLRAAIEPYNGHLIATTRLLTAAIVDAFGAGYLPFRLIVTATVLLTAGLFFEFARRRIGAIAALAPTLVLL